MTAIDRTNWPDHLFREHQAAWEAREAAPEGWEQRVEAAARAMSLSEYPAAPFDRQSAAWQGKYRRLAAAALTADAPLAGQHTADEEANRG